MIIKADKNFETRSDKPNEDWYHEGNYIIDETTEEGCLMAQTYKDNYPFVVFEHDGEFITRVTVLEEERQIELARLEQERIDNELLDSLIPSDKEMLMAEVEINTIILLMEVGLI